MIESRILVWFSCGAASAVCAKKSIEFFTPRPVTIVNCDTRNSEDKDNYRFSKDIEKWCGREFVYLRNEKYKDVDEVFEKTRYMSGIRGARCTTELKKIPRLEWAQPDDINVFGYHYGEEDRAKDFEDHNPDMILRWILIELEVSKQQCFFELRKAGIELPLMYRLGFDHNNCPGCVKSKSVWYWDMVRTHYPEVFARRVKQSREIGCRLIEIDQERRFLDELPPGPFKKFTETISCGPECGYQPNLFKTNSTEPTGVAPQGGEK